MKHLCKLIFLVTALSLAVGCRHDQQAEEVITCAQQLLETRPDSALAILDSIRDLKDNWPRSQRMHYELVYAQAQNKACVDFSSDSIVKEVVEYYDLNGTRLEKMRAYYVLGCAYRDMGEVPKAIDAYSTATQFEDSNSSDDEKRILSSIYSQMAYVYHLQLLLSEEIEVREKSIRLSEDLCDTLNMACDYCRIAGAYNLLNENDKSEEALKRGKDLYIKSGHSEIWTLFSPMLIDLYLKQVGKLDTVKQMIDEYETTFGKACDGQLISEDQRQFYFYKGKYYEQTEKLDSADICYRLISRHNMTYTQKDPMYRGLLQVYQRKNIADSIAKYAQLYCEANDSSIALNDREQVGRMVAAYKYVRYQKEANIQNKIASRHKHLLMLVSSASIILLLCFSFVIVCLRKNKKEKQTEILRLKYELENAEKAYLDNIQYINILEQAQQKVNNVVGIELEASKAESDYRKVLYEESQKEIAEINRQYNELMNFHRMEVERLKLKIDNLSKQGGISAYVKRKSDFMSQPIIQKVLRLVQSPLGELSDNEWEQLVKVYAEYYPELIHDLQQNPQITKQGIHACLLFALNLRSSDVANILMLNIQRVSNLKTDINTALFNDHSAKQLINNLKQKYDLYIGI